MSAINQASLKENSNPITFPLLHFWPVPAQSERDCQIVCFGKGLISLDQFGKLERGGDNDALMDVHLPR